MSRQTLSAILVIVAGLYLVSQLALFVGARADAWFGSDPYAPLEARPFVIPEGPHHPGDTLEVRNGLCNVSDIPVYVELFAGMQQSAPDGTTLEQAGVVPLIGTADSPEPLTLFPGCVGTQPVYIKIPEGAQAGAYHVFLRAVTRGEQGQEQRVVLASDPFEVTED